MSIDVSRIKAICFDIDGTLSETDDLYVEKVARLLKPLNRLIASFQTERIARRIIMGIESPGNWLYSIPDRIGIDDAIANWMNKVSHRVKRKHNFILGSGITEMLMMLRKIYPLAVVTVRGERETCQFLDDYNLGGVFKLIIHGNTCRHTKPFPDPLIHAADTLHLRPYQLLMVGDTTIDIECAKRAGAQSIGVLSGFGEEKELLHAGADLILTATSDLSAILVPTRHDLNP